MALPKVVSAAEVGTTPERWYSLAFFPDGWVDLPLMGRSLADTRRNLRKVLGVLVLIVGGMLVVGLLVRSSKHPAVVALAGLIFLGAIGYGVVTMLRIDLRDLRQRRGDTAQLMALRERDALPKRAEGVGLFQRARSAEEHARMMHNVRATLKRDVVDVTMTQQAQPRDNSSMHETDDGGEYVATVRLGDGQVRRYRSPDKRLAEQFAPYRSGAIS